MEYPEFHQYIENMAEQMKDDLFHKCHKLYHSGGLNTEHMAAAMIAFIAAAQDKAEDLMDLAKRAGLTNQVKDLRHF